MRIRTPFSLLLLTPICLCLGGCFDEPLPDPEAQQTLDSRMTEEERAQFVHDEVESAMPPIDYGS